MTDLLTDREEVNVQNSRIIQALTLPVQSGIERQVRRFGFEYEMLPYGYADEIDYDNPDLLAHMEDFDAEAYAKRHYGCDCDSCIDMAESEEQGRWWRANASHESGARGLAVRAYEAGLTATESMHDYHCHCATCDPHRSDPLMCAQEDGSCGIEFVSRILDLDDFPAAEIADWVELFNVWKQEGNWMPNGVTSNGNHVHVSSMGDESAWPMAVRTDAFRHINTMYAVFFWDIADGGCGQIRGYNSKPSRYGYGGLSNWLADRGYGTFEHRLWNTPAIPERLWAHLGISVGITRWAFNIATAMPDFAFSDHRGITDPVFNLLHENVGEITRGISACIPAADEFDIARDLIAQLR